jgi:hypothetical protein
MCACRRGPTPPPVRGPSESGCAVRTRVGCTACVAPSLAWLGPCCADAGVSVPGPPCEPCQELQRRYKPGGIIWGGLNIAMLKAVPMDYF